MRAIFWAAVAGGIALLPAIAFADPLAPEPAEAPPEPVRFVEFDGSHAPDIVPRRPAGGTSCLGTYGQLPAPRARFVLAWRRGFRDRLLLTRRELRLHAAHAKGHAQSLQHD